MQVDLIDHIQRNTTPKLSQLDETFSIASLVHSLKCDLEKILSTINKSDYHSSQLDSYYSLISSDSTSTYSYDTYETLLPGSDKLQFGMLWGYIKELAEQGLLLPMIASRRNEIRDQKEEWRQFIERAAQADSTGFYASVKKVLDEGGQITRVSQGAGSAYFLCDVNGQPRFVVKPVDEDIFCLNNRKQFGSPFGPDDEQFRVREGIPLYRSAQTDAFCWELAKLAGLSGATPQTIMGILGSEGFYDISDNLEGDEKLLFLQLTGEADKEKLCSIQEYIPDSCDFYEILHQWMSEGLSDEEIASRIDQDDFEAVNTLIWLTGDTDAHTGNLRVYVKSIDASGKKIYGIKKIDNGLSMPERNGDLLNYLAYLPNAEKALSPKSIQRILDLPVEDIVKVMKEYGLEGTEDAFKERVRLLQNLVSHEGITIGEINSRLEVQARYALSDDGSSV